VDAPYKALSGTSIVPIESRSVLIPNAIRTAWKIKKAAEAAFAHQL
jgi:hypothetical protein